MDKDEIAVDESQIFRVLLEENMDSNFYIKNKINLAQINARIFRSLKDFTKSKNELLYIINTLPNEKYTKWEVDYYQALIDFIAIEQQTNKPYKGVIDETEKIIYDLNVLSNHKMNNREKANLLGQVYLQKSNYYGSINEFRTAKSEVKLGLELLRNYDDVRAYSLRLYNLAVLPMLEMSKYPSKKQELAEEAAILLDKSISVGTLNSSIEIKDSVVAGCLNLARSYYPYLEKGETPPRILRIFDGVEE